VNERTEKRRNEWLMDWPTIWTIDWLTDWLSNWPSSRRPTSWALFILVLMSCAFAQHSSKSPSLFRLRRLLLLIGCQLIFDPSSLVWRSFDPIAISKGRFQLQGPPPPLWPSLSVSQLVSPRSPIRPKRLSTHLRLTPAWYACAEDPEIHIRLSSLRRKFSRTPPIDQWNIEKRRQQKTLMDILTATSTERKSLSIYLGYLSIRPSLRRFACSSIHPSIRPTVRPSVCLSIYLFMNSVARP